MYHIAISGSEEEKLAAAKILCGASLVRGWNVQVEHYILFHLPTVLAIHLVHLTGVN